MQYKYLVSSVAMNFVALLGNVAFLGGTVIKNLSAKQEMQVQSLGQEDPLEEKMETHSSIFDW